MQKEEGCLDAANLLLPNLLVDLVRTCLNVAQILESRSVWSDEKNVGWI